jgi:hypothetical protein
MIVADCQQLMAASLLHTITGHYRFMAATNVRLDLSNL